MEDSRGREWATAFTLACSIKLAFACIDFTPRIFLGDSATYLAHAMSGTAPPDRSFLYALVVRALAVPLQDVRLLLLLQTLAGAVTAAIVHATARSTFTVPHRFALLAAAAIAIEPTQLFYERMLMAESFGTLAFAVFVSQSLAFAKSRRSTLLVTIPVAGILAVGFRLNLLPVVLGATLALPAVTYLGLPTTTARRLRLATLASVTLLASTLVSHQAFRAFYDEYSVETQVPAYIAMESEMRLALVAPLLQPSHFATVGLAPSFTRELELPLADPSLREAQLWSDAGFVSKLRRVHPDRARAIARKLASRAVRDSPAGFLAMQLATIGGYFDCSIAEGRMADDLGGRGPDRATADWFEDHLGFDPTDQYENRTPVFRLFGAARWWLTACLFLLLPLALVAILRRRPRERRPPVVLLALIGIGMVTAHGLFSMIVSYRYLHPFPVVVVLLLCVVLSRTTPASSPSSAAPPRPAR